METLMLTAAGTVIQKGKAPSGDPLSWLSLLVELEEGFSLSSFFALVKTCPVFLKLSPMLPPLLEIAEGAGAHFPKTADIERLVFYKTVAMKGFPGTPAVDIYNSLKGMTGDGKTVGLKFFQVESLLGHVVRLGALHHVIFGDNQALLTYDTHYTLFEFLDGVIWEMSFNFNPLHCSIRG